MCTAVVQLRPWAARSTRARNDAMPPVAEPASATGTIEIDFAGGHRMRITGNYDPEALARLIRGLSA